MSDRGRVLPSKLRVPRAPKGALRRRDVIRRLRADRSPIVLVHAPAGYGKTTAVQQWTDVDRRPAAWVTLDRGDDDPLVLLRHVSRALHELEPLPAVEQALHAARPDVAGVVLPALGAAVDDGRAPFLLVLDDVHLVESTASLAALDRLIDMVPPGSRLVLVSRTVPPLHLARRRLAGTVQEITQRDLTFSEDETRTVLHRELPGLDERCIAAVSYRTESWPAGVHLAVLALRDNPGLCRSFEADAARDRHITAYFHEEFLGRLDDATRSFLLRTSVLERFTPALCDAVLGCSGSERQLEALADSGNLFLAGFEAEERWFRYHNLFADLLLAELRRSTPAEEPRLRRRAATWLATHGVPEDAVAQALQSGDRSFAAAVIYDQLRGALGRGEILTLERWLSAFSADDLHTEPLLALSMGWLGFVAFDAAALAHWLEVAAQLRTTLTTSPGAATGLQPLDLEVEIAALHMMTTAGGLRPRLASAQLVRDRGLLASKWWGLASLQIATTRFALADDVDMVELFTAAEIDTREFPAAHVVVLCNLALAHELAGNTSTCREVVEIAAREAALEGLEEYTPATLLPSMRALVAARAGALDDARKAADIAERLCENAGVAEPRGHAQARLVLAEAALACGDHRAAARHLNVARHLLALEPDATRMVEWHSGLELRLERLRDRYVPPLTPSERRVLEQLATHRSLEEIAEQLYVTRNTVKTHALSVYRKLGVSGRSAAVDLARELHVLDG